MKSLAATLNRIFSALEFANVEGLHGLQEMLDRHESQIGKKTSPAPSCVRDNWDARFSNVHYLSPSAPAK